MFKLNIFKPKDIVTQLQKFAVSKPSKIAFNFLADGINEKERITYFQLDKNARVIAAYLQHKKWQSDHVVLLYSPGVAFIQAFLGCLYAGVIPIPIAATSINQIEKTLEQIQTIAKHAGIVGVLTNDEYASLLEKDMQHYPALMDIPVVNTATIEVELFKKYKLHVPKDDDTAYLQYTSGSTSEPKAVVILHKNLTHNLKYTGECWKYTDKSVMVTWAPHSHVYGLVCGLLVPLYHGSSGIIIPPQIFVSKPYLWLQTISKYKATHTGCPNFGYDLCVNEIKSEDIENVNLQSWKVAINGGEPVRADTINKFIKRFSKYGFNAKAMFPVYGMSELAGTIAVKPYNTLPKEINLSLMGLQENKIVFADEDTPHRKFISNGKLMPGIDAAIVDPDNLHSLPPNKIGEICLSGAALAAGYYNLNDKTRGAFRALPGKDPRKLYFLTGDLGFIFKNEVFITGRSKEVIILYGKKYYPLDLETAVAKSMTDLPVIPRQAVFAVEEENQKPQVIFLQEVQTPLDVDLENKIIKQIRKTISETFSIDVDGVLLVKESSLPKTPSGKLQRKLCQTYFSENKLQVIASNFKKNANTTEQKKEKISHKENIDRFQNEFIATIADVLKIEITDVDLEAALSEFGFDSITVVRLTDKLNENYKLNLTPARMFEYKTLQEFLNDIAKQKIHTLQEHYQEVDNTNKQADHFDLDAETDSLSATSTDIAIIGMSGIFPEANNVEEFWENLSNGKDVISEIPKERWDWEAYYGDPAREPGKTNIKWGGFIPDIAAFDAAFFNISPREAELTDPQQRKFLQVVWNAIEDAGYSTKELAAMQTGMFVGVFNNDYAELLQKSNISDAYITTGITHSILANRVSYLLNLQGPSEAIDTACSSSLVALHNAVKAIQDNDCEIAIVGGVNALLTPTVYLAASQAGMLSPDGRCKTFDIKANGYVRAEGMAAIIIKSYQKAKRDGDHVYAIIKGTAINHGGHVSSLTVPNPNAQAEVIATAWERAGIAFDSANYIEAHGTGTSLGDPIEINGLKKAFQLLMRDKKVYFPHIAIGAVKTHIGHLEAAAGVAGIIKILLALKYEKLPANLHFTEANPYIELKDSPFYLLNETVPWLRQSKSPRRAGISSFGFGGTNAHIVLEEGPEPNSITENNKPVIVTLSAKTSAALQSKIKNLHKWLLRNKDASLTSISYTLNVGRNHFENRCAFIVETVSELIETLQKAQLNEPADNFVINSGILNKNKHIYQTLFPQLAEEISNKELFPNDLRTKLIAVANFYVEGFDVPWKELYKGKFQRISLPSYPFAKENYWIPQREQEVEEVSEFVVTENDYTPLVQQDIKKLVASLMKINIDKIKPEIPLAEIGFDSISFKELALNIENKFKVNFLPSLFFSHNTVENITKYLLEVNGEEIKILYKLVGQKQVTKVKKKQSYSTLISASEPIAIIGMDALLPHSQSLNEFWEHLEAGDDLVTEVPGERWDWRKYYGDAKKDPTKTLSKWGSYIADVDKFDAAFFNISAREANLMDPQQRLLLQTIWKTFEDAGFDPTSFSGEEVGLFIGVEFNDYNELIIQQRNLSDAFIATGTSLSMLANRISYFFNFHGPSEVIDTACSSSLVAMNRAVNALRNGECTLAIAGGVSLNLSPTTFIVTSQLGALSPDGRCKTFDKSANGYVKGEGVGTVLLKPLSKAEQDGNTIYGIIKSISVNHGGKAQSLTAPNASAQSNLIVKTYQQANIDPDTISYIEAHGTGTELGDPIEIEGLKAAFKQLNAKNKNVCGVGSLKTNIGHLEPASGVASVIKVLLAMKNKKLPALLNFNELSPYIDVTDSPFYFVDKLQEWKTLFDKNGNEIPRRAGISSFGFGGTNAHLVLEEPPHKIHKNLPPQRPYYLVVFSAKTEEVLYAKVQEMFDWLQQNFSRLNLPAVSFTLNAGRTQFDHRCAVVVSSLDELLLSLQGIVNNDPLPNCLMNRVENLDINSPVFNEIYSTTINVLKNNTELEQNEYRQKLMILGDLFVKGHAIDWDILHSNEASIRVSGMPTYPFQKNRYWLDQEIQYSKIEIPQVTMQQSKPTKVVTETPKAITSTNIKEATIDYLKNIFAAKLRIPANTIAADETYEVYGVNSILGTEITSQLIEDLGAVPKTILYEKNNLNTLADYLIQKHKNKLQEKLTVATDNVPVREASSVVIEKEMPAIQNTSSIIEEDIAIIGIHGIYPQANNLDEFWQNLLAGKNSITEIPKERWNYKDYPVEIGGETKYFNAGGFIPDIDKFDTIFFGISPREAAVIDPQERLFMQSSWAALEDAGYTRARLQKNVNNNVGVFAGVTYNFYPLIIAEEWKKGNRLPLDSQNFSVPNRISYFFNLNGPSYVVDTACSSSLSAIHLACESLRRGECQMAIAGGVNLSLHPSKYHFLGGYGFLSDQGICASFGEGGAGYVPAEGVGTVILKPLTLALRDNDQIYGVIKASAMNHGGKTSGYTVPNPNAQASLIRTALDKAHIKADTISYIEAHGTGTALGDPIEVRGLQEAFEVDTDAKQFCAIGSVKSNIGHAEAAAGVSQLTKVLLQFKYHKLVPSIHTEKLNPLIDFPNTPFYVQKDVQEWHAKNNIPLRAGISSFGAGGTNVHLIVEEFVDQRQNKYHAPENILLLSALNEERLRAYASSLKEFLLVHNDIALHDLCYTLQIGRENFPARFAAIVNSREEAINALEHFLKKEENNIYFNVNASSKEFFDVAQNKNLQEIAQAWIAGKNIKWDDFYAQNTPRIISLPTYPFAKRRCWVNAEEKSISATERTIQEIKEWLYKMHWVTKPIDLQSKPNNTANNTHWIIFSDVELGFILQDELGKENCSYIFASNQYEEIDNAFYIDTARLDDYERALERNAPKNLGGIIYLWDMNTKNDAQAAYKLLFTLQALQKTQNNKALLFTLVTRGAEEVLPEEGAAIYQHYLWSMARIFAAENGSFKVLMVDLDNHKSLRNDAKLLSGEIKNYSSTSNHVAYRHDLRHVIELTKINELETTSFNVPTAAVVTGGLGALGEEVTQLLIAKGCKNVLVIGSTPLDANSQDAKIKERLSHLENLQKQAKVEYAAVDVKDKEKLQQAIYQAESTFGTAIDSVFHLAGITTDSITIADTTKELLTKVLDVKVKGAMNLHEIFLNKPLKYFVMFSSIASLPFFGMSGLSAYAMANEFMNGLASYRRKLGLPALSIAWAAWAEKGMSHRYSHDKFLDAVGMSSIPVAQGIKILEGLLTTNIDNVIIFKIQWEKFLKVNAEARKIDFFAEFSTQYKIQRATKEKLSSDKLFSSEAQQRSSTKTQVNKYDQKQIKDLVTDALAKVLQLEKSEIDGNQPYSAYGLDSIVGVNFVSAIDDLFPDAVSPMDLYRYPTVNQLSNFILEQQKTSSPQEATDLVEKAELETVNEKDIENLSEAELEKLIEKELDDLDDI